MSIESDRSGIVKERSSEAIYSNGHAEISAMPVGIEAIRAGDTIVALADNGLRGCGIPGAEAALILGLGEHWQEVSVPVSDDADSDEEQLLGDFIYAPPSLSPEQAKDLVGKMVASRTVVHAMADPNGHGLVSELRSLLAPTEFGADIADPYEPSRIMRLIQTFRRQFVYDIPDRAIDRAKDKKKTPHPTRPASDRDMYTIYPMGHGPLIITPDPEAVLAEAAAHGQEARAIGLITAHRVLTIVSRATNKRDTVLEYEV